MKPQIMLLIAGILSACGARDINEPSVAPALTRAETASTIIGSLGISVNLDTPVSALRLSVCNGKTATDTPDSTPGDDCDGDGGVVAKQTPRTFAVAFKRLYVLSKDHKEYTILSYDKLSNIDAQGIFEFTSDKAVYLRHLPPQVFTAGIAGLGYEIYYFELSIIMYQQVRKIRIYLSDDDFPEEGKKGHHQGDITWFSSDGNEHWAKGGKNWFETSEVTTVRGDFANGIGGADSETGHKRGMFGDAAFWNEEAHRQGSMQDIYSSFSELSSSGTMLSLEFDVSNTWFYEDFTPGSTESFDPCFAHSEEGCGGEWAPLFPEVTVSNEEPRSPKEGLSIEVVDTLTVKAEETARLDVAFTLPHDGSSAEVVLTSEELKGVITEKGSATHTLQWTPTTSEVRAAPYPAYVQIFDDDGSGYFKEVKIYVKP